ncbi:MAG: succinate--CoA ligase subunit alpha [Thermoplasmata archaeon]|nr:MAG: succinate--CoA ligase subunit alpha [Thermoplasmata archaeon]MCD6573717.1 succinate--CoA ligase subunit alpha [Thermoplasmata archaeon]
MAIWADENIRLLVQGITGHQGQFHTKAMQEFGTNVVAGVTPGKGGMQVHGVPVYNSVEDAMEKEPNASIVFVPAAFAKDAVIEALDAGIKMVVVITENIPFHDAMQFIHYAMYKKARVIGPNCPGIASPGKSKIGIFPNIIFSKGSVGIASRSGTLTYEIVAALSQAGIGQSTCIGLGGDPVTGTTFIDALKAFEEDEETKAIVMVGEIGGTAEEEAAEYIKKEVSKPVYAYIAGRTAPAGKRMGHAGAIISGSMGTAESKIKALEEAGVKVARFPYEIAELVKNDKEIW